MQMTFSSVGCRVLGLSVMVVVSACGGTNTRGTQANAATASVSAAPVYAPLFQNGASWKFSLLEKTTPPTDMGPATERKAGEMTCTVSSATTVGATQVAIVECKAADGEGPGASYAPNGVWAANDQGLWWVGSDNADTHKRIAAGTLPENEMLIGKVAQARRSELNTTEEPVETTVYSAEQKDGNWCISYVSAAGDEAGWTLCLDGKKVTRGSWFTAGATVQETFYQ